MGAGAAWICKRTHGSQGWREAHRPPFYRRVRQQESEDCAINAKGLVRDREERDPAASGVWSVKSVTWPKSVISGQERGLAGKKVLVTRPRERASQMTARLRACRRGGGGTACRGNRTAEMGAQYRKPACPAALWLACIPEVPAEPGSSFELMGEMKRTSPRYGRREATR